MDRALAGVDRVFHLGGIVGNGESMVNVRKAIDANSVRHRHAARGGDRAPRRDPQARRGVVDGRLRRGLLPLRRARRRGPGRCGPTSSCAARDWEPRLPAAAARELEPVPTREDAPLRPTSVYGITKRDHEELALVLGEAYGLETVALRYLNVYGPRQALGNPYTGVAAIFAARLLAASRRACSRTAARSATSSTSPTSSPRRGRRWTRRRRPATRSTSPPATRAGHRAGPVGSPPRSGPELEPEITGEFRAGDIRHCFADTDAARRAARLRGPAATWPAACPSWPSGWPRSGVDERGDEALAELRARGLIT